MTSCPPPDGPIATKARRTITGVPWSLGTHQAPLAPPEGENGVEFPHEQPGLLISPQERGSRTPLDVYLPGQGPLMTTWGHNPNYHSAPPRPACRKSVHSPHNGSCHVHHWPLMSHCHLDTGPCLLPTPSVPASRSLWLGINKWADREASLQRLFLPRYRISVSVG